MIPKEARSRRLYSDILTTFERKQHRDSFAVLLDLMLEAKGRPLPEYATAKSPSALSRFLNLYDWNTRALIRAMRRHAASCFAELCKARRNRNARLELLIDLTNIEKTGHFERLGDFVHVLDGTRGVHLVVLYVCCGPLRLPWAFTVWRGKDTPSPHHLALKLLRTLPTAWHHRTARPRVFADGGFDSADFIHGVLDFGFDLIVGVRRSRALEDGRHVEQLTLRGSRVQLRGLRPAMTVSWVWLYRNKVPEQRFVMSNLDLGGVYLARLGKKRWRVEGFFKTIKGRFGLGRFAQATKRGVLRFLVVCLTAFFLCHLADLDAQGEQSATWPDWGALAHFLRCTLLASVRRAALLLELEALDAVQDELSLNSS